MEGKKGGEKRLRCDGTRPPCGAAGEGEGFPHVEGPNHDVGISGNGERPSGDREIGGEQG